ncbi:universal stress protein [Microvirga lotononidis]|uniref:Universal stress protein n=1 Tax=Microvirga lotononidis TaxID=864069 RepID=I4Z2Z0_9HYPH|nr:universal stress protein [Microvirga lotononidis]EIM30582.1 universal stress protein UspA-like protein [Microvirga lotononidis]WQO26410.1 universal stress protein [Microvirga lotononidis]
MFKTILVPVDLGEIDQAQPAIDKAVELAKMSGGSLRLIYVRAIVPVTYMEFMPPTFDDEQQGESEKRLAGLAAKVALPSERVSAVVRLGSVYNEVLDEAEQTGADLVVIGSHRPTMATYLLGSNAATIVRHAKCSVLVVRA